VKSELNIKRLSHELNTALAALKAGVRRLEETDPGSDLCRQGTERLEAILNDLNSKFLNQRAPERAPMEEEL
jgi:hypothetical protein